MRARWVLFFIFNYTAISAKDVTNALKLGEKPDGRPSEVETLLGNLLQEQWNEDEVPCLEAIQALLHGVRNHTLWATWMWDSMQRPTGALYGSRYQLGNFDQCMKPLWGASHPHLGAQYCLADIDISRKRPRKPSGPADPFDFTYSYMNKTTKHGRHLNIVTRGVCLPRVCQLHSIVKVVQLMHRHSHLASPVLDPLITVHSCQLAGEQHQYSDGFYYFLYLVAALCIIAIISTYSLKYLPHNSFVRDIAQCFDIKNNCDKLTAVSKDEIKVANSIKCTNSGIAVCVHYVFYANTVALINGLDFEKSLESSVFFYMVHVDLIIDAFYAISGLLLAKKLLNGNPRSVLKNLLKRYIRILAPLAVMVYYMACVHPYVGDGPLWPVFSGELQRPCLDNWWLNLLLINNYVNETQICHTVTWYISSDFHLALFGTLLCYLYRRNQRAGKTTFVICFVVAMLLPGFITYWKELPTLFFNSIHEALEFRTNKAWLERYMKTQYRAAAYLVGMALGYIMMIYKPTEYRNTISKIWSLLGTLAAIFVMIVLLHMGGNLFVHEHSVFYGVVFTVFNRTTWAVAVCCIIALSEYGTVPVMDTYLNWSIFVPLSRLCYGTYLSHMALVYYCIYSIRSPIRYDEVTMIITGLGVVATSVLIAFCLWLFVEAPVGNLSNYLLDAKREEVVNGTAKTNVVQNGIKTKVQ